MGLIGLLALGAPGAHERDADLLHAFVGLDRPHVSGRVNLVAHLTDPVPYALAGLAMTGVALLRGLRWRAAAVAGLLVVTGAATQVAKHLLAEPRFEAWLGTQQIGDNAWPSGHATAAMTLALCAVLVAPPAWRLVVALAGGAFAAGVGYALLVLAWHFPSDVLGGFLMAAMWTALAVALLRVVEDPSLQAAETGPVGPRSRLGVAVAGAGATVAGLVGLAVLAVESDASAERSTLALGALVIAALAGALSAGAARAA